jgi:hypothetical protein
MTVEDTYPVPSPDEVCRIDNWRGFRLTKINKN